MKYNYILNQFLNKDPRRPAYYNTPVSLNGYTYASNSEIIFRTLTGNIIKPKGKRNLELMEKIVIGKFFMAIHNKEEIPVFKWLEAITNFQYQWNNELCENCDGHGKIINISSGDLSKCKKCKGKGQSKRNTEIPIKNFSEHNLIEINGKKFNPFYIDLLLKTALILQAEKISVGEDLKTGWAYFKIRDTEFILAHCDTPQNAISTENIFENENTK